MRSIFLTVLAVLAGTLVVSAQTVRDLDIRVEVAADGSARVTQVWDVSVVDGTEWYIPISNLDRMAVKDLTVSENGQAFTSEGRDWDVHRSLEQKAGRCGIVDKGDGVELCWGQGSYGDHRWTVGFTLEGLVQGYEDADGFNFQFVNPGLASPPRHVRVTIVNATGGPAWTYDNTRIWGFGSEGRVDVTDDGTIVYESSGPLGDGQSVILLTRFEKGLFQPVVTRDKSFEKLKKKAMKGSSYQDDEDFIEIVLGLLLFAAGILVSIWAAIMSALGYKYRKSMFGKTRITEWYRDVPVEGNLFAASYILDKGRRFPTGSLSKNLIGALFLKWILDGDVKILPDPKKESRVNLDFSANSEFSEDAEAALYRMALEASGGNMLLEAREFERWSEKHYKQVVAWPDRASSAGKSFLMGRQWLKQGTKTTPEGAVEACHVVEFKNFLKDFTLSKERGAVEVGLWKNYLVFAQLYGIADKVASQFQKLYPKEFQEFSETAGVSPVTMMRTIRMNNNIAAAAMSRAVSKSSARSGKGLGGFTSIGGGGGFSGGGFGGGSR